jgi:hypothetical protein
MMTAQTSMAFQSVEADTWQRGREVGLTAAREGEGGGEKGQRRGVPTLGGARQAGTGGP